jgi:hypothetical protein
MDRELPSQSRCSASFTGVAKVLAVDSPIIRLRQTDADLDHHGSNTDR